MLLPILLESGLEPAMQIPRTLLLLSVLLATLAGSGAAQQKKVDPDAGYIPVVAPEDKKKKKGDEITQALPPSPELPSAVTAETARLTYQVSPLSSKGLLSQQTRDALKILLKTNRGPIVKLRAFVAGSGDLRRDRRNRGRNVPGKTSSAARAQRRASGRAAAGRSAGGDRGH